MELRPPGLMGLQDNFRRYGPCYPDEPPADFLTLLDELGIPYHAAVADEYRALTPFAEPLPDSVFGGFQIQGRGPLLKFAEGPL